jgi:tetratricopeptide (TPR) repeat protein
MLADACQQVREVRRDEAHAAPGERAMKEAFALHNLFLSARALSGRDEPRIYQRAARAYRASVSATQTPAFAPLGFAALLAAGGERPAARMELERLPTWRIAQEPSEIAPTLFELVAAARAALGERERALEALAAARDLAPDWALRRRGILAGNDFDALRTDPRFVALVGEAE